MGEAPSLSSAPLPHSTARGALTETGADCRCPYPVTSTAMEAGKSGGDNKVAIARLMGDLKELTMEPNEGCSAAPLNDDNPFVWAGSLFGPADTPWEGGIFSMRVFFSPEYPVKPPKVRFTCEMFHPNVYSDGVLCLDIIQDQWKPIYTVGNILISIQSMLTDPNCASPANPEAAQMYQNDRKEYNRRVRRCAQKSLDC